MSGMKINCGVYRCASKANTYLYLERGLSSDDLPEGLQHLLGELTQFLSLELSESSRLAQVDIRHVLTALAEQGYYLQMPPAETLQSRIPDSAYIQ
jgi:uncharacterized protein YcgL (UPF0745 family)